MNEKIITQGHADSLGRWMPGYHGTRTAGLRQKSKKKKVKKKLV